MRKQMKQDILTLILILAAIALLVIIGFIGYDIYKEEIENENIDKLPVASSENENKTNTPTPEEKNEEEKEEYVGKEEEESENEQQENTSISNEQKAIDLVKKEWGEDDSVTFNIEEKSGNKYYVAIKQNAATMAWYEVDIETWTVSKY